LVAVAGSAFEENVVMAGDYANKFRSPEAKNASHWIYSVDLTRS